MLSSNGRRFLTFGERIVLRLAEALRRRLLLRVRLEECGYQSIYECENALDALRPLSLWIKEEGTMRWIDQEVRPGDVFMDIGANIGIYTIAAAHRVGATGIVYAFEPHKVNALSLARNVRLSAMAERVQVFGCALAETPGTFEFNYRSLASASTASQLGHRRIAGSSQTFEPLATEMMFATTVDQLISDGVARAPHLVKIDVDGNEIAILRGMRKLLISRLRPRAIQVELNVGEQADIAALLADCGYALGERHHTHSGRLALAAGVAVEEIAHNAIFRPVAA